MAYRGPSIQTHLEWLGLVQPVGLVVAPVVLDDKELYPESQVTTLADGQRRLADLLEERELESGHRAVSVGSFERFATEILEWSNSDIKPASGHPTPIEVVLEEYGEVLKPSHVVAGAGPDNKHDVLVQELPAGTAMDELLKGDGHGWEASPNHRFERLLKESEHPIGLLFNGEALRLIFAPRGESSGHITFPLEPMTTVAGRPMLGALQMLLGVDRMFSGSSDQRLPELLHESRKRQNDVSTRLAAQVLEALWELLLGFDEAERNAQNKGSTVLGDLPKQDPDHIYGGLITVLLRLVFLLYAEDEDLMPPDSLYGQHYSVSGLAIRLRQEADEHKGGMASRRGAWASLLSLFRLVYDGGGATEAYLPARHGELFDPDAYPFLEGRNEELGYEAGILNNLPAISDDVVEKVLSKLLWLDGERLSYRALDVEQIGSVYEGIMGFRVEQAQGTSVGITHRPPRQKITISVVVNAEELLEQPASKREKWLDDQAGVKLKLPAAVKKELKSAFNVEEVLEALGKRLSPHTPRGLNPGSLVLQPTAERRRSGSHYTPRSLTEPIVKEAFRPWLERNYHKPTAEAILDLKVCDPAMGSGAFLVATCRYLAGLLVEAWERDGFPADFEEAWDKDIYARRLVAQRCLYGVDKNPFAVNLARLSLWLVTLSKELPFTFVDHALKCGDSLVGVSRKEIEISITSDTKQGNLFSQQAIQLAQETEEANIPIFQKDTRNDMDDERKQAALNEVNSSNAILKTAGDLIAAAFFNSSKKNVREKLREFYLETLLEVQTTELIKKALEEPLEILSNNLKSQPMHWELEFPNTFNRKNKGFDVIVGNPPFLGGPQLSETLGSADYQNWLKEKFKNAFGNADLCAYFFRKSYELLREGGTLGLIATKTIAEGSTRTTGLQEIVKKGGKIYAAKNSLRWPGEASVIVSTAHIIKTEEVCPTETYLANRKVEFINSRLLPSQECSDPKPLKENQGKAFMGTGIGSSGFILEREEYETLASNKENKALIMPLLGGEELNTNLNQKGDRFIINFKSMSLDEASKYPDLLEIVKQRVKPSRDKAKDHGPGKHGKKYWWQYTLRADPLYEAITESRECLTCAITTANLGFVFTPTNQVYSHSLVVFPFESRAIFACLESSFHNEWAHLLSSNLGRTMRYSVKDCFQTFPFPNNILSNTTSGNQMSQLDKILAQQGTAFEETRDALMLERSIGLTAAYNSINDPYDQSETVSRLRKIKSEIDITMAQLYGWNDLQINHGYRLEEEPEIPQDKDLPESLSTLQEENGTIFFKNANDACAFQENIQCITGIKTRLRWKFSVKQATRDDLLGRLLSLNTKRQKDEPLKYNKETCKSSIRARKAYLKGSQAEQQLGIGGVA